MADLGLAAKVRPVLVLSVAYEGQELSTRSPFSFSSLGAKDATIPSARRGLTKLRSGFPKSSVM
jgi:hypothetical protein